MGDLISRSALIKALEEKAKRQTDIMVELGVLGGTTVAKELPTVEAEPVVHGEWVDDTGCLDSMRQYKCSECGKRPILGSNWVSMLTNYCPNCGAKMDGGV